MTKLSSQVIFKFHFPRLLWCLFYCIVKFFIFILP